MVRVIAEAGMCRNSVSWALEAAEAARDAGCWGFKVQLLHPDRIASPASPRYDRLAGPASQHEAFQGALPYDAWETVRSRCVELGIEFLASAWDLEAVDALEGMGCRFIKVGSADITYLPLLRRVAWFGMRPILSTGAANAAEVGRAVDILGRRQAPILFACTLSYPATDLNLGRIRFLHDSYPFCEVGYSDHSLGATAGHLAAVAGATWLEKHFTITPGVGGDHDFALTPADMAQYVHMAERGAADLGGYFGPTEEEEAARALARRSLHAIRPVAAGEQLRVGENCDWLRPAPPGGVEPF